jgi:hypothetical protein
MALKGSCLCGGIRFETAGMHSKIGFCHCSKCRKCSGTGSTACIKVGFEGLRWLAGQDLLTAGPKHSFCRVCGSPMPDLNPRRTVYDIPVGCLDDNPKLLVSDHSWVGSKADWDAIADDGAPRYANDGPPMPRDQTG